MAQPWNPKARRQLANLLLRLSDGKSAQAILEDSHLSGTGDHLHEDRDTLGLLAIAGSSDAKNRVMANRLGQKSIMLTPGRIFNWQSLAVVRSRLATTEA